MFHGQYCKTSVYYDGASKYGSTIYFIPLDKYVVQTLVLTHFLHNPYHKYSVQTVDHTCHSGMAYILQNSSVPNASHHTSLYNISPENRGSYMSAHVLLILLNKLGKRDNM